MAITFYGQSTGTSAPLSATGTQRSADLSDASTITWTEIVASTPANWGGFYITASRQRKGAILIATGAASSEVIIATIPTALFNGSPANELGFFVPIPIASGTRISVGNSQSHSGITFYAQIAGVDEADFDAVPTFTSMDSGPFALTTSGGTYGHAVSVDPGGTANTKGAWTEIVQTTVNSGTGNILNGDSLDHQYKYLGVHFTHNMNTAIGTAHDRLWDVAYGASGSETAFITDFYQYASADEYLNPWGGQTLWLPWDRASGDRIATRMQSSNVSDANDRLGAVFLLGLR